MLSKKEGGEVEHDNLKCFLPSLLFQSSSFVVVVVVLVVVVVVVGGVQVEAPVLLPEAWSPSSGPVGPACPFSSPQL